MATVSGPTAPRHRGSPHSPKVLGPPRGGRTRPKHFLLFAERCEWPTSYLNQVECASSSMRSSFACATASAIEEKCGMLATRRFVWWMTSGTGAITIGSKRPRRAVMRLVCPLWFSRWEECYDSLAKARPPNCGGDRVVGFDRCESLHVGGRAGRLGNPVRRQGPRSVGSGRLVELAHRRRCCHCRSND